MVTYDEKTTLIAGKSLEPNVPNYHGDMIVARGNVQGMVKSVRIG